MQKEEVVVNSSIGKLWDFYTKNKIFNKYHFLNFSIMLYTMRQLPNFCPNHVTLFQLGNDNSVTTYSSLRNGQSLTPMYNLSVTFLRSRSDLPLSLWLLWWSSVLSFLCSSSDYVLIRYAFFLTNCNDFILANINNMTRVFSTAREQIVCCLK